MHPGFDVRCRMARAERCPSGRLRRSHRIRRALDARRARLRVAYRLAQEGLFSMVRRPDEMQPFEFAVLSTLRAAQLQRGCTPRVERCQSHAVTAQREVAEGKVLCVPPATAPGSRSGV